MPLTKLQINFLAYVLILILISLFSWIAYFRSYLDPVLIYQPLKSYFLPITLKIGSVFYDAPTWLLASEKIKIELHYKIINQICNCLIALGFIGIFLQIIKNQLRDFKQIKKYSLWIALIAVFCIPADSSDLFAYVARGYQQLNYESNPFANVIADIQGWQHNPLLANTQWQHNPSPYGPLFMLFTRFIAWLSFNNLWLAMLNFKFANLAAFILILSILEHAKISSKFYALIALNPFIIIETIWNGHNDIYMALTILLALYLSHKAKYNLAILALIASILIKYISVVLLPLILIQAYQNKKQIPWLGLSTGLALTGLLVSHYNLLELNLNRISENINLSHKSFYDLLNSIFKYSTGNDLPSITRYVFLGLFIAFALWLYYKFACKRNSNEKIYSYGFWVLFALICVFSPKFHSWYLVMLMPLGILVHPALVLALSLSHLLSLTPLDQANMINFIVMTAVPSFILLRHPNILQKSI